MDIFFFKSGGELFFIILTMIPILFYLIWRIGYNLRNVKIPVLISITGAFYFYFTTPDFFFIFKQSMNIIIEKLLFFNLLFFSTIFAIIILIVPSNQNFSDPSQSSIIQEDIGDFTPLLDWKENKNKRFSASLENGSNDVRNFTKDKHKELLDPLDEGNSDDTFQKLIDDLFKNQNKSWKE